MQERRFGTAESTTEPEHPRMFTGRNSSPAPRTEAIQRLYVIPEFMRAAAESWCEEGNEGTPGCTMRQAASVIFVRDGDNGLETILTHRARHFAAGRGGLPRRYPRSRVTTNPPPGWAPGAEYWQKQFHYSDVTKARRCIMGPPCRESFEETGILLAARMNRTLWNAPAPPS